MSIHCICLFLCTFAGGVSLAAGDSVKTIKPDQVDSVLQREWRTVVQNTPAPRGGARDWQMKTTTWLPSEWPPTPQTTWTRYAYGLDVTMDGASGVSAPFLRLERSAGDEKAIGISHMADRLKQFAVHPVRPRAGWNYGLDDEKRVLSTALQLTSAPQKDARTTIALISYYQSWRVRNAEIADHVSGKHRLFFKWLDEQ